MDIKESFFIFCAYAPHALKVVQYGGDFPPLFFFCERMPTDKSIMYIICIYFSIK